MLVSLSDFRKASGLNNKILAKTVMRFAGIHKLNVLYANLFKFKGIEFTHAFFLQSNIKLEVDERELARIPGKGEFITISNHPYGGVDGLALIELIGRRRGDYKIMANFLLKKIEPISDYFIGVNPFETHKHVASSIAGMKQARQHLSEGKPLGVFPAGEVSTYQDNEKAITDRNWQLPVLKLIKNAGVPIIPIYFHGNNSWSFHLLGKIHPLLRTLRLPHELTSKSSRTIRVRIGHPITAQEQGSFNDVHTFGRFLRIKTYSLGSAFAQRKSILTAVTPHLKPASVKNGIPKSVISEEISKLHDHKILSQENFDLYLTTSSNIPNILLEIGRLREITFRKEGEGTNKHLDLDRFDTFYHHLFLYDRVAGELVGAYRIGKGLEIMDQHGYKGFYTNTLFSMDERFISMLSKTIELGRSFIIPSYQNKRLPLFLLWRAILIVLGKNPHYTNIIGPVSISNTYSKFSKGVLVAFIQRYYFDRDLARSISAKKKYKPEKIIFQEAESLLDLSGNDLKKLDQIIDDIEPGIKSAPVLLKKYIKQNARIIGFNVDPKFNQALDGLMILSIKDLPTETIDSFKKQLH